MCFKKDTRTGQPSHPRSLHHGVDYLLTATVNWTLVQKRRTEDLNRSDTELLCGSQYYQYRNKEKTRDRPRIGCITAVTSSLSRGISSSQPLYLSLLYKRNDFKGEKNLLLLNEIVLLLENMCFCAFPCLLHSLFRNFSPSFYLPIFSPSRSVIFHSFQSKKRLREYLDREVIAEASTSWCMQVSSSSFLPWK